MKRIVPILTTLLCRFISACPMCKDSIATPENASTAHASGLPGGFNNSVYIMLAGLFLTIGFVATGLVKAIRGADSRITSSQNSPESEDRSSDSSQDETE